MSSFINTLKRHPKTNITMIIIGIVVYTMLKMEWDVRAIAIITLIIGYVTNVFIGLTAVVGALPLVGPMIVKIFTIPLFWLLNLSGYFTSAVAIKKGYGKEIMTHRLITLVLLSGLILGYILGHLIPVR